MTKRLLTLLAVLMPLFAGGNLFSAETNVIATNTIPATTNAANDSAMADLNALIGRINEKLTHDKNKESDLADNIKEFDVLVAKHKDASPDARAQIVAAKAQLYIQVLDDSEKALAVFKQIKTNFPTVQINGNIDEVISNLQESVEKKKVRDALAPGTQFPDFKETDLDGRPLSISQYKGKVVLIDFWATWCMPCVIELPDIQKAYDKFHDQGFQVVGVSLDDDKDRLKEFVQQRKMPWPQYFDGKVWENKLAVKYGIAVTPTIFLIDRDGKIIGQLNPGDDLDKEIAQALKR
ncbi:MAG TPA: TlpA disulfide reductase family protein [Verrucomicrobiae bacterium]|jgi:peroxiredoxin